jgi:hypothetical protein
MNESAKVAGVEPALGVDCLMLCGLVLTTTASPVYWKLSQVSLEESPMAPRLDRMAVVFIDKAFTKEVTCDPKLVTEALQFRIAHQMMGPKAFYLNITVWKLV